MGELLCIWTFVQLLENPFIDEDIGSLRVLYQELATSPFYLIFILAFNLLYDPHSVRLLTITINCHNVQASKSMPLGMNSLPPPALERSFHGLSSDMNNACRGSYYSNPNSGRVFKIKRKNLASNSIKMPPPRRISSLAPFSRTSM